MPTRYDPMPNRMLWSSFWIKEEQSDDEHCCDTMTFYANFTCDDHPDPIECPHVILRYSPAFREYGLVIHGSPSAVIISRCPWCGSELPPSRRDDVLDQLDDQEEEME